MKQTAVYYLHSEYKRIFGNVFVDVQKVFETSDSLAKAKEIEKQQIIEAGNSCALKQHLHSNKIDKMTESELIKFYDEDFLTFGEQYYNETFNK